MQSYVYRGEGEAVSFSPGLSPALSLIIPTYNERENVCPLVEEIASALQGICWEAVFVDDDSPDQTFLEVQRLTRLGYPVRCLRRIGRCGLTSAVMEGVVEARGSILGVMDADLQHDPMLLPQMLDLLRTAEADVVIASRHLSGGGLGSWTLRRRVLSRFAMTLSRSLVGRELTDPMSGFFLTRRESMENVLYKVSGLGFKVLLDLITSSPAPLKLAELPYTFGQRTAGESKLTAKVATEYLVLLLHGMTRGLLPPAYWLPLLAVGLGAGVQLAMQALLLRLGEPAFHARLLGVFVSVQLTYLIARMLISKPGFKHGPHWLGEVLQYGLTVTAGCLTSLGVQELGHAHPALAPCSGVAASVLGALLTLHLAKGSLVPVSRRRVRLEAGTAQFARRPEHQIWRPSL